MSPLVEVDRPRLDGRLLVPALVAWAAVVVLLPHRVPVVLGVGLTCLVLAGPVAARRRVTLLGARRRATGLLALSLAVTGLVCSVTAAHLARDRAGPLPGWGEDRAVAEIVGTVTTEPRVISSGDERPGLVVVELRVGEARARGELTLGATPVLVFAKAGDGWEELAWRSTVHARGRLQAPDDVGRPVAVFQPRGLPEVRQSPGRVLTATDHVREAFRQAVDPLPADARGLVPGLVIGDTSLTPADLTEAMRATGMTHLSAVSGSNVALVTGAVAIVVARLGVGRRWRTPLILLGLVGFVLLCRPEPSVLRAGVMGTVGLLALSSARRRVSLPTLAAAVIALLCVDPWLARSYGFALSTMATLGLVLWSRPWADAIAARLPRRLSLVGDAIAVPLAAQVACAPVIVLLQGNITTVAVLANLLAAPLVAPTTVLGVVAAVLSPVSLLLGTGVAWLAALPAWTIGWVARRCADLPWGTLEWVDGVPGAWLLAVVTAAALASGPWWRDLLRRRPWVGIVGLGAVLAAIWPTRALDSWPPPGWVVVGCDVGQGDAFVVRTGPASGMLVDTGPDPDPLHRCLRDLRLDRLDAVVLSHFHADHVAGLGGALRATGAETAYLSPVLEPPEMSDQVARELSSHRVAPVTLRAGDVVQVGAARVEVLAPGPVPVVGQSPANNGSLILDVRVGERALLFTGDIEPEGARPVRSSVEGRDYDILKVAHHGSAAQDAQLVADSRAEVAMIGVGPDNTFGHPAPSALELLHGEGMVVLRTDLDGDIAVSDGEDGLRVHRRGAGSGP
ncbi:ComEC/Rec2 family competence protein [Ornithinimicrobium panacihumi]|uniref:ComEC/Rec2 family competence protein n=1 Tax=Ornithinimicrobium panacihumi TaxID=2008449 RepID=UPI003F8880D7